MSLPGEATFNPAGYFPGVFVNEIAKSLQEWMPSHAVQTRPVRNVDPPRSIGVFSVSWRADQESFMIGQAEPTLSRYVVRIQNVAKGFDEGEVMAAFANDAKTIRVILYRDTDLRVRLGGLQEAFMTSVERVTKMQVLGQDYLSTRLTAEFMHVATTDVLIETETTFAP